MQIPRFFIKKKIIPIKYNLSFINSQKKINYFIFGIEKKKQLKEILNTEFKNYDKRHIKKINSFFDKKILIQEIGNLFKKFQGKFPIIYCININ